MYKPIVVQNPKVDWPGVQTANNPCSQSKMYPVSYPSQSQRRKRTPLANHRGFLTCSREGVSATPCSILPQPITEAYKDPPTNHRGVHWPVVGKGFLPLPALSCPSQSQRHKRTPQANHRGFLTCSREGVSATQCSILPQPHKRTPLANHRGFLTCSREGVSATPCSVLPQPITEAYLPTNCCLKHNAEFSPHVECVQKQKKYYAAKIMQRGNLLLVYSWEKW